MSVFFPEPLFCWIYLIVLWSLLVVASYLDLRTLVIPKALSLMVLGFGLALNIARGAWLGAEGGRTWLLHGNGMLLGGLDGLLFALAGFVMGFGLFFILWIGGVCGGGDVKLFAALGAWTGPVLLLGVLGVTAIVVAGIVFARLFFLVMTGHARQIRPDARSQQQRRRNKGRQPQERLLTFSLPLAIACLLVLPWAFRHDLHLAAVAETPAHSQPAQTSP